jgi:hypothetical protein
MSLKLTSAKDYIIVEFSTGMDFWEIMESIPKLCSMPEFLKKNDIWVFRVGKLQILYADLYKIKDTVERFFPQCAKDKKTAIVTETGIQHSLATMYSDIGKDLPREIKAFSDLKSARDWVTT